MMKKSSIILLALVACVALLGNEATAWRGVKPTLPELSPEAAPELSPEAAPAPPEPTKEQIDRCHAAYYSPILRPCYDEVVSNTAHGKYDFEALGPSCCKYFDNLQLGCAGVVRQFYYGAKIKRQCAKF